MTENYRAIVENSIGRTLTSDEIVHHKDGDSHNNKLDNLEITSRSEHGAKLHPTSNNWTEFIKRLLQNDINITATVLDKDLSYFFTERQKQIIFRKVYGMELSKTEREYFSRSIKKKLVALSNSTLHKIAHDVIYGF